MRRSMDGEKGMAEALKDIGERLDFIEQLLGDAMRRLEAIEAATGSGNALGKGPADACGNLVWHC